MSGVLMHIALVTLPIETDELVQRPTVPGGTAQNHRKDTPVLLAKQSTRIRGSSQISQSSHNGFVCVCHLGWCAMYPAVYRGRVEWVNGRHMVYSRKGWQYSHSIASGST